ncbi:MAG: ABC transporter substrate-binding protein, partial [Alphaproteobacteria bacterium]
MLAGAAIVAMTALPIAASAQKAGGTLRVYHRGTPPSASIHEEATTSTNMPFMAVYNNLVIFDQDKVKNSLDTIMPELATGWSWDDSKTKLTFKLREGVKWHDGKPFTSADVKCTWDMLLGTSKAKMRKNPRKSWYWNLKGVSTNGDMEATFELGQPQPSFLALLASGYSPVYPCHVSPSDMRTNPVGTGPFKFVEMRQNESVKFVRNEDYWDKGKPYLDAIDWTIIKSRSTRILAFVADEFDMTFSTDVTIPLLKDVKEQAPNAICEKVPTGVSTNLIVNREAAPFDNEMVRKAMNLVIDRDAFITILS